MTERIERQIHWRWKIAFYLFLAGMGAGAYLVGVLTDLFWPEVSYLSRNGVILGTVLVISGIPFLIFDLGRRERFYRAGIDPQIAWIGRGFYILSGFIVLGLLHIGFWVWPLNILEGHPTLRLTVATVNGIFAFGVMAYTGLLLKSMKSIHFWDTPLVVVLFFLSALSTGVISVVLCSIRQFTLAQEGVTVLNVLLKADLVLIFLEALVLGFYLGTMRQATEASEKSVLSLIRGDLRFVFWGGVVFCGVTVPFILKCVEVSGGGFSGLIAVSGLLVLAGGLLLRYSVLAAGVRVTPLLPGCR